MRSQRGTPQSVAVENVVFVEFRAPTKRYSGRWDYLDSLAADGREAISTYKKTIMRTRELARRARELTMPGVVQLPEGADPAAALLLGPDSADSFRVQRKA